MNFFERRRILRGTSFTDLTPVSIHSHEKDADGRVNLIVPKFRNRGLSKFLIPGTKKDHFQIRLDELGSFVWLEIDGQKNVSQLCESLVKKLGEKVQPHDELQQRVMKFISQLYDQRYVTFREIMDK